MPQSVADLRIDARWLIPMSSRDALLERHSLLVRNGRIIDILPTAEAAAGYAAEVIAERHAHVLLPGLINGNADAAATLIRLAQPAGALDGSAASEQSVRDGVRFAAARLLKSGTTCIADRYFFPDALARAAQDQGLRAHVGLPIADVASPWARDFGEYLSRALSLRDEFRSHPLISTCFAPFGLADASFLKLATIADELDASLVMEVHRTQAEIDESLQKHGERPLERLARLGVLTPAFTALHMNCVNPEEIERARQSGIGITLSQHQGLASNGVLPPVAALAGANIRFNLGSGPGLLAQDVWAEMRLTALALGDSYRALKAVTCDAAAVLGLDTQVGTLEPGKWADLCCIEATSLPTLTAPEVLDALIQGAARELVSDVWIAGRPLLAEGALTRLDWPRAAPVRADTWRHDHAGIV